MDLAAPANLARRASHEPFSRLDSLIGGGTHAGAFRPSSLDLD
jgi:hypothetical protein